MKCVTCKGTGQVANTSQDPEASKTKQCPTCKGKRLKITNDVSDGVRLPIPQGSEDPKLAPDIAGYVTPDLETWKMQLEEMHEMKKDMFYALWGTSIVEEQGVEKTATEVYINKEPINETLEYVSATGEQKETILVRWMAELMHPGQTKEINRWWGRRYMIETPDVLWDKYITAKEKSAPLSTLDYLYQQFLSAEYHNDLKMLDQKMKEFCLEPMVHYSILDLKDIASDEQLQRKLMYAEWVLTVEDFGKKAEELKEEFEAYFKSNYKPKKNETITEGQD